MSGAGGLCVSVVAGLLLGSPAASGKTWCCLGFRV